MRILSALVFAQLGPEGALDAPDDGDGAAHRNRRRGLGTAAASGAGKPHGGEYRYGLLSVSTFPPWLLSSLGRISSVFRAGFWIDRAADAQIVCLANESRRGLYGRYCRGWRGYAAGDGATKESDE